MSRACALARGALAAVALLAAAAAQARDERTATVGMRAFVEQLVLPGSELEPAPSQLKTPVVVRVLKVWPHGELRRYDFEWVALEPGRFDLAKFLVRKDGSAVAGLPEILVEATSALAPGTPKPSALEPTAPDRLGGYRTLQIVAGVAWLAGLLAILFAGRHRRRRALPPPPVPTLADRLRPLVERVAAGDADTGAKAELERLLVAFWRARLDLREAKAADAIVAIKQHAEAGALLRQLEAWLHVPSPPAATDVAALLAPYRSVTAESFEPIAAKETR
jgi:hypothetical protein